jgi:TRAP-type C4-dicarboxylate transport system permease small subunit
MKLINLLMRFVGFLVLPLVVLLFAQWPLRDWVQAYSRQANDVAQILFALYMAVAITAASVGGTHLAAQHSAHAHSATPSQWKRWAVLICIAPWTLFMLWAATPMMLESIRQSEKFGETLTPGYFLIKVALVLLALLVLLEAVLQVMPRRESES